MPITIKYKPVASPPVTVQSIAQVEPVQAQPSLVDALKLGQPEPGPWEPEPGQTIQGALKLHWDRSRKGLDLVLVHRETKKSWLVKSYDPETGRASLEALDDHLMIKPVITDREDALYEPFWRTR